MRSPPTLPPPPPPKKNLEHALVQVNFLNLTQCFPKEIKLRRWLFSCTNMGEPSLKSSGFQTLSKFDFDTYFITPPVLKPSYGFFSTQQGKFC